MQAPMVPIIEPWSIEKAELYRQLARIGLTRAHILAPKLIVIHHGQKVMSMLDEGIDVIDFDLLSNNITYYSVNWPEKLLRCVYQPETIKPEVQRCLADFSIKWYLLQTDNGQRIVAINLLRLNIVVYNELPPKIMLKMTNLWFSFDTRTFSKEMMKPLHDSLQAAWKTFKTEPITDGMIEKLLKPRSGITEKMSLLPALRGPIDTANILMEPAESDIAIMMEGVETTKINPN